MTTITIKTIIDANSVKDAHNTLVHIINTLMKPEAAGWDTVVAEARTSELVNGANPASYKLNSISRSQILDRMGVNALAVLIYAERSGADGLSLLATAFKAATCNSEVSHWPFGSLNSNTLDRALGHDVGDLVAEALENSKAPEAKPEEAKPEEVVYNVTEDIATAANVLLRVATNGEVTDLQELLNEVVTLRKRPTQVAQVMPAVTAAGDIPEGKPVRRNAQDVFGMRHTLLDFDVTCYEWDGANPYVPKVNPSYVFDVENLADLLWAIENNVNAWLTGHTGTGKSTMVAQMCAYTGRMLSRVNLDSGIERPDFVGAMAVETTDDGKQVTAFKEGALPKAMQMPCILLLDEYDAIRADISYVMQPILEGEPLRLLEDGGRLVHPHPDFHIVATANSAGMGDRTGLYASAVKVQSRAAINRFGAFIKVDYMPVADEMRVAMAAAGTLSNEAHDMIEQFVTHYRSGFLDGTIATPISPRNTQAIARYAAQFEGRIGAKDAVRKALNMNVMHTIDEADAITVTGIMDRVTPA